MLISPSHTTFFSTTKLRVVAIRRVSWNIERPVPRVISVLARLCDLLGLLSPVVFRCKIFPQQLWLQGLGWDDTVTSNLIMELHRIELDLQRTNKIEIPRFSQAERYPGYLLTGSSL